jgi:biotin carboxylase
MQANQHSTESELASKFYTGRFTMPIAARPVKNTLMPSCHVSRDIVLTELRGKRVVFVSPGYPGKRFVFEKAHEVGVKSVIIDSHGSWTNELESRGIVEKVVEIDMARDEEVVFSDCVLALSKLEPIDGICTFVELSAPLTARLCEKFNLPGHSVESVAKARNKHETRLAVASHPATSQYAIKNFLLKEGTDDELVKAAEHVGFPAVLKPVSGAASLGVQKVTSLDELLRTYRVINDLVSELIVSSGALERRVRMATNESESESTEASAEQFHSNVTSLQNTSIVLEEYLCGQEVDIDIVLYEGEITFSEISDNGPTVEPYFGETYNCCPSLLPESDQLALQLMASRITVEALGFRSGVFHVEAKMTQNGPRLIECNARCGGGPIRAVHLMRSNVDLVVEQLLLSVGLAAYPVPLPKEQRPCIGFFEVNATRSGSVNSLEFLEPYKNLPGMIYFVPFVKPGEHIVGPEEGQPTWVAEALFTRDTPEEAARDSHDLYVEVQKLFEAHYV